MRRIFRCQGTSSSAPTRDPAAIAAAGISMNSRRFVCVLERPWDLNGHARQTYHAARAFAQFINLQIMIDRADRSGECPLAEFPYNAVIRGLDGRPAHEIPAHADGGAKPPYAVMREYLSLPHRQPVSSP